MLTMTRELAGSLQMIVKWWLIDDILHSDGTKVTSSVIDAPDLTEVLLSLVTKTFGMSFMILRICIFDLPLLVMMMLLVTGCLHSPKSSCRELTSMTGAFSRSLRLMSEKSSQMSAVMVMRLSFIFVSLPLTNSSN